MGVLAMLATILFTGALVAALLLLLFARKARLVKYLFSAGLIWYLLYGIALVGVSLSSREETVAIGEPKRFCGFYLDCHMMARVRDAVEDPNNLKEHNQSKYLRVQVEISSDARRAKLGLHSPEFSVVDRDGNRYYPIGDKSTQLAKFEQRIGHENPVDGLLVFDLPKSAVGPRLDVRSADPIDSIIESVVIGDEDSLFHKRKYLSLLRP